ncbi:ankyrin repeat domain-containing protein [bacterium]|nr:ankyrin repeat domain-containing protein [bacterium]
MSKGADVNEEDESGWTALMRAAMKGHTESVRLLKHAGAEK